jgi:hypothetical protein
MFIIHGVYHLWPKRVAFRNDYCLGCGEARRAVATRTFDVGHIFWIPILPAGFWKHWQCTVCGTDPHISPKTRRSFKWAGLVCLILVAVIFWAAPVAPEDEVIGWILRISAPVGAILLLMHLLRTPKDPPLRRMLATVHAATDSVCPFCGTPLIAGTRWSCPGCGAIKY